MPSLEVLLPKVAAWQQLVCTRPAAEINVIKLKLAATHRANWPALASRHLCNWAHFPWEPRFILGSSLTSSVASTRRAHQSLKSRLSPLFRCLSSSFFFFLLNAALMFEMSALESLPHLCLVLYFGGCGFSTVPAESVWAAYCGRLGR